MNTAERIAETLRASSLAPTHLQVFDDSHLHAGGSESHFRVLTVSERFTGITRVMRHRQVHSILSEEIKQIHALSLQLYTPEEWRTRDERIEGATPCAKR
ncbi:MAG: BolA family transcriptional regulator [Gammaproteobacteria bacterium AqS3]|nr:BolA family transcriptional regulator [Gammaproteobacteria bacterium AqS3]